jgi:hypothetical protein
MKFRSKISYSLSLALVISLIVAPTRTASAEECKSEKCIEVTVDDESDEIVVTVRGGKPGAVIEGEKFNNLWFILCRERSKSNLDSLSSRSICRLARSCSESG